MVAYICTNLFLSILGLICSCSKNQARQNKFFLLIAFVLLFGLTAMGSPYLGTDTFPYTNMFLRIGQQHNFIDALETSRITAPAYVLLCRIVYKLFPYRQAIIVACAFIINYGVFSFIKKSSLNIYLSVILYMNLAFYLQTYNGTRQYIAVSLLLNTFLLWKDDIKSVKGWLLYVIAVAVHSTAIVGIAAWIIFFLQKRKIGHNTIRRTICETALIGLVLVTSQTLLLTVFLRIFPRYSMYFGDDAVHSFADKGQGRLIIIVFGYLIVFLYCLYLLKNKNRRDSFEGQTAIDFLPICLLSIILGIFGAKSLAISRMNFYFAIVNIVTMPNTICLDMNRNNRFILSTAMVVTTFMYFILFLIEDKSGVVPYVFFWEI